MNFGGVTTTIFINILLSRCEKFSAVPTVSTVPAVSSATNSDFLASEGSDILTYDHSDALESKRSSDHSDILLFGHSDNTEHKAAKLQSTGAVKCRTLFNA